MQSGTVARPLGMTKAIGYKGKAKGTSRSKIDEEERQKSPRHQENR